MALRKRLICDCGCKGWCTMFVLFQFLKWSIDHMAIGEFPEARHDGTALDSEWRQELARTPMEIQVAILFIKTDLSELAHTFGLPQWNDGIRPCVFCNCHTGNM